MTCVAGLLLTFLSCLFSAPSVGDRKLIDSARINLGMARGNMSLNKYMGVVNDNLPALLNWKTRRQAFKQV